VAMPIRAPMYEYRRSREALLRQHRAKRGSICGWG
jgi:hypothetical protein